MIVEIELNESINEAIRKAVVPAVERATAVFAEATEANLQEHRSEVTGTADSKTDQAKSEEPATPLADSVRKTLESETAKEVAGKVFIDPQNAIKALALEFGHNAVEWGRDAGFRDPDPFMRRAFENTKEDAVRKFAAQLATELQS